MDKKPDRRNQPQDNHESEIKRIQKLLKISHNVNNQQTLSDTARAIVESLQDLGFDRASVWLQNSSDDNLRCLWASDPDGDAHRVEDEVWKQENIPCNDGYYIEIDSSIIKAETGIDQPDIFLLKDQNEGVFESIWGYPPPFAGCYKRNKNGDNICLCFITKEEEIVVIAVDNYITKRSIDELSANLLGLIGSEMAEALAKFAERKQMEEVLGTSEARYKSLFEQSPFSITAYRPDGTLISDNQATRRLLGLSDHDIKYMFTHYNILEDEQLKAKGVMPHIKRAFAGEQVALPLTLYEPEQTKVAKDVLHNSVWIESYAYPIRDERGNIMEVVLIHNDITQRKQAEEKLRRSEALLDESQRLARIGGWEYDVLAKQGFWTDETYRIHEFPKDAKGNYSAAEVLKISLSCFAPEDIDTINRAFNQSVEEGKPYDLELQFTTLKGKKLWVRTMGKPQFQDGKVMRVLGNIMDITEKKLAEEALRKSEELYRTLMEALPVAVALTDMNGKLNFVSQRFLEMYGYESASELIGKDGFRIAHDPEVYERLMADYQVMLREGIIRDLEDNLSRKDGSRFVGQITGALVRGRQGEPEAIISITRDITDRKRATEALRRSEAFLDNIIEQSPYSMWISDDRGTMLRQNQACRDLLKIKDAEVIGKYNVLKDDVVERQGFMPLVRSVFEEGKKARFELDYKVSELQQLELENPTRVILDVTISPVKDTEGKVTNAIVQHVNITQRKEAEEKLHQSVLELSTLHKMSSRLGSSLSMEHLALIILEEVSNAIDPDWVLLYMIREEELVLIGQHSSKSRSEKMDFQKTHRLGECLCGLALSQRQPIYSIDIHNDPRCTLPKCKKIGVRSLSVLPLLGGGEKTLGGVSLVSLTERDFSKQAAFLETLAGQIAIAIQNALLYEEVHAYADGLEKHVSERTKQLEAANKELEAFSYSVSHDLRAPLRAIDGFSRILIEDYESQFPGEAARYLKTIRNSTQQMDQLIDDLLTFSRLSRKSLKKRLVDPAQIVHGAVEDLRHEYGNRKIEICVGELPQCWADPSMLKQVFMNLLSNAIKFTQQRDVALIEVGCQKTNDENVFFVKDNGVGFDIKYAEKLFNVFQRLHRAEEYEGTGVGLAIAQRIIHRHDGRIWAESEVGKGANFYFTIEGGDMNGQRAGGNSAN